MSKKNEKIDRLLKECRGYDVNAHYLAFFKCFNRQLYYEAHDVLEALWLPLRKEPMGNFYKGLIQLAGAFVHLQKERLKPSAALFRLAQSNLKPFAPVTNDLSVDQILSLTHRWLDALERNDFNCNPLHSQSPPRLQLLKSPSAKA